MNYFPQTSNFPTRQPPRQPSEHLDPTTLPWTSPPQMGPIPLGGNQSNNSSADASRWMSNYMQHVGFDRVTGQPVHADDYGNHFILPATRNPETTPVEPVSTASTPWNYLDLMRSSGIQHTDQVPNPLPVSPPPFQEPPLPQGPGQADPNPEPTPITPPIGGYPMSSGPHDDDLGLDPTNSRNNWLYDWPNYRGNNYINSGHGFPPRPPGTLGPEDVNPDSLPPREPWENQPPFFEPGGYRSIGNPNGGGYVPDLGGAQSSFTGTPSQFPTSWVNEPGLGWVPRAEAVGQGGAGSGGGGGSGSGGGNPNLFGRIWQHTPLGALGHLAGNIIRGIGSNRPPVPTTQQSTTPTTASSGIGAVLASYPQLNTPAAIRAMQTGGNPAQIATQLLGRSQFDQRANSQQLEWSTRQPGRANLNIVDDKLRTANSERGAVGPTHLNPQAIAAFMARYGAGGVHTAANLTAGAGG